MLCGEKLQSFSARQGNRLWVKSGRAMIAICVFLLTVALVLTYCTFRILDKDKIREIHASREMTRIAIETHVNENPDNLYVADESHALANPFTVFSDRKLVNYIRYGASFPFTPYWYASLRASGRDTLTLDDFWDDDVYLISREPNKYLVQYFYNEDSKAYFRVIEELPGGLFVFSLEREGESSGM